MKSEGGCQAAPGSETGLPRLAPPGFRGYGDTIMIYLDHAATTPVRPEVLEAMLPWFTEHFGNPSSVHRVGLAASGGVSQARRILGELVGLPPSAVVFTAGGTEADVLALRGVLGRPATPPPPLVF